MKHYRKNPVSRRSAVPGSPITKAVLRRLRDLGADVPGPDKLWCIKRTYAGHLQRSSGAWSWCLDLQSPSGAPFELLRYAGVYGGYWPASLCCKHGSTLGVDCFGYWTLEPNEKEIKSAISRRTAK